MRSERSIPRCRSVLSISILRDMRAQVASFAEASFSSIDQSCQKQIRAAENRIMLNELSASTITQSTPWDNSSRA